MIIKLKKFLIYGIKEQMDVFFEAAQEKGFIEFIGKGKKVKNFSSTAKDYISAIKILKKQPIQIQSDEKISSKALVSKILHLNQSLEKLFEDERLIESEIMRIAPFGDFSTEEILNLEKQIHRYFQFFTIKKSTREKFLVPEECIYINTAYDLDYFIAINQERKTYPKMIEIFIEQSLELLRQKKLIIGKQIVEIQKELKELAKHMKFLMNELIIELNVSSLELAKSDVSYPIENSIFLIQAWVPENKLEKLDQLTKNFNVNFEEIAIEKSDRVPTYLENKGAAKIGEDLVTIYDVPSINDKDPSMFVLVFFAIFFAVIIGDLGYGLVLLILSFFLKFKIKNPKPLGSRIIKLSMILSVACIGWGILVGSFFGIDVSLKSPLNKVILINNLAIKKANYHIEKKDLGYQTWVEQFPELKKAKDGKEFLLNGYIVENNEKKLVVLNSFKNSLLMEFSLLMGVIHLTISFLRYIRRNWAGLGWILFMIGGYLYFPSFLKATSMIHFLHILDKPTCFFIGKILLYSGIGLAMAISIFVKKFMGILDITVMISVFADIMSYVRLYALGLAGVIMADTFNTMGLSLGIIFGPIVILGGHIMNLLLNIMSGSIHGLRLNFIEWYHYSFEGDGKLFDPLRLLK